MRPRTAIYVILVIAAAVWLRNAVSVQGWESVKNRLLYPYRAAKLSAVPPDAQILMPVVGVSKSRIVNTWNAPRPIDRKHKGQDIFAPKTTPVISATDGLIARFGESGIGGRSVSILGPGGRTYYYAHLDEFAAHLEVGAPVAAGTVIGTVGNTGNARTTPPHLHFGVYTPTGPVDPLPLITESVPPATDGNGEFSHLSPGARSLMLTFY